MTTFGFAMRGVARDLRAGELRVLTAAVAVAVTAMTAVAFFTDRVSRAVDIRSAEVLAADLVVNSKRAIEPAYQARAQELGLASASVTSFPSVVLAGESSALADVEAVSPGYPLRGQLTFSDSLQGETRPGNGLPARGQAWADAKLLARLGIDTGAEISLGAIRLTVSGVLRYRPDQGWSFVDLAPTILINDADLAATGLVQPGSRVNYRLLFAGESEDLGQLRQFLDARLAQGESLRDLDDAGPEIKRALDRAHRFLSLAALVGSLLAAVAIAMAARRQAGRQVEVVALLKCFGAGQGFVLRVMMIQLAIIAVTAGLIGVLLGFLSQLGLTALLADVTDLADGDLPAPGMAPVFAGFCMAALVMAGFALPILAPLRRVPPLRVLRQDLPRPRPSILLTYGAAGIALFALLLWQVGDLRLTGWVAAGFAAATGGFLLVASLLVWLATRIRGSAGAAWRYAIASLARRGGESVVQVVAFGLGIMVLLLLTLVRNDLMQEWRATLPADAPNRFLINIQPTEAARVEDFLGERGAASRLVPLVRARLTAIDGRSLSEIEFSSPRGQRLADREGNLSWAVELQEDNEVIAGDWWGERSEPGEVSVEADFARDVGIELGDELDFDVAGEAFSARVTSLRTVQWDSFRPNFFMLFSPGTLEEFPRTHIGSLFVDDSRDQLVLDLVRQFPSITVIDIDAVMGQVRRVMDQAALAVQYVFLFAIAAGIVVLLAVVESGREERMFESALMRAMGARRRQILAGTAIEFALLGTLSGLLAAGGALAAGWMLAELVFQLDFGGNAWLWLIGAGAGLLVVGSSGLLATRKVLDQSPMAVLRRY
ncbi:MAG: FtsX-like permease family protein [Gammaproteobacteria bacterium]